METTIPAWECLRCGYKWAKRSEDKPIVCANPKCRSPYWDKPRRRKKGGNNVKKTE